MNKINNAIRYAGKLVLTLFLLICLFVPNTAFALDYESQAEAYLSVAQFNLDSIKENFESEDFSNQAKNYLSQFQKNLDSIKPMIKELTDRPFPNGLVQVVEIQWKLEDIESDAKQEASRFTSVRDVSQIRYNIALRFINDLDSLRKESSTNLKPQTLNQVNNLILQFEQEGSKISKIITFTDKVSKLIENLEKRVDLAKDKINNVREYAEVLESFSDPDILDEIKDLDQYIGKLNDNLPL